MRDVQVGRFSTVRRFSLFPGSGKRWLLRVMLGLTGMYRETYVASRPRVGRQLSTVVVMITVSNLSLSQSVSSS